MTDDNISKEKQITIAEFKTWLEGAEAFQGEDWTPDTKQWKIIRQKIHNLVEEEGTVLPTAPMVIPQQTSLPVQHTQPVHFNPPQPQWPQSPIQKESGGLSRIPEGEYESSFK